MSDHTIAQIDALRARAGTAVRASSLEQFREDFKAVWRWWYASGQISEAEMTEGYAEASAAVREKAHDSEWMKSAMDHFASMADQIRTDRARSERIAEEVRAAREKTMRRAA